MKKIQFSFDDLHPENERLFQLMIEYECNVIWFLDFRDEALAYHQIKEFSTQSGHQIGNHTINHKLLTKIDLKEAIEEIKLADEKIKRYSFCKEKPKWFCAPRGYTNPYINDAVKKLGYKYIRLTGVNGDNKGTIKDRLVHLYPRPEYNGMTPFDFAKKRLKKEGRVHIWGHSWEIEKFDYWDMLEDFLMDIK